MSGEKGAPGPPSPHTLYVQSHQTCCLPLELTPELSARPGPGELSTWEAEERARQAWPEAPRQLILAATLAGGGWDVEPLPSVCGGCQGGEGNIAGDRGAPLGTHPAQWTPAQPGPPRPQQRSLPARPTAPPQARTPQARHPQRPGHGGTGGPLGSLALGGDRDTGEGPSHSNHLRRPAQWTRLPSARDRDWCQSPGPTA